MKRDLDALRTSLANERTLLAYIRTALAMFVFGMGAIKFFTDVLFIVYLGWIFIICGILLSLWGAYQFRRVLGVMGKE